MAQIRLKLFDKAQNFVITNSTASTNLITYAVPTATMVQMYARVLAWKDNPAENYPCATWVFTNSFKRGTGSVAFIGSSTTDQNIDHRDDTGITSATAVSAVSGGNILINVTGTATYYIFWYALVDFTVTGPQI